MKTLTTLLTALALFAPAALSAAGFEGTVTMAMTGSGGRTMPMTFSLKPGFTRVDFQANEGANGMSGAVLMDQAKKEMTIVMPQQKMYMVRPMPQANAAEQPEATTGDVTIEKTNEHAKILGYDTTKYIGKSKDGTSEIWITDQLGTFMGMGNGGGGGGGFGRRPQARANAQHAWEEAFRGKDAFPLRVITTGKNGGETFKMEATAIDKKSLPDSLFQPPADFQKFDMGNMMRGMGMPGMGRPPRGGNNGGE